MRTLLAIVLMAGGAASVYADTALLAASESPATSPSGAGTPPRLLLYGDSLFAGYGFERQDEAFGGQLQAALDAAGVSAVVVPGAVSGDTTRGGVSRLAWTLAEPPDAAIVALGANDMLRGLSAEEMTRNLHQIVAGFRAAGVPVLLCGLPPLGNYGAGQQADYAQVFPSVAATHAVPLHPDLLMGVAGVPDLNQADGIHPNAAGVARMVDAILPAVRDLLGTP